MEGELEELEKVVVGQRGAQDTGDLCVRLRGSPATRREAWVDGHGGQLMALLGVVCTG